MTKKTSEENLTWALTKTEGVMFDKEKFRSLLEYLQNNPDMHPRQKDRIWNHICMEYYFPLVRHQASRLNIPINPHPMDIDSTGEAMIDPWEIVSVLWERTSKFDLKKGTSPLAYFMQMAFFELITKNKQSNNYSIRPTDILVKDTITLQELQVIENDFDYRILEQGKTEDGKVYVIYQHINPVVSLELEDLDNILAEEELTLLNLEKEVSLLDNNLIKKLIEKHASTKFYSDTCLKFYNWIMTEKPREEDKDPNKKYIYTTNTALWAAFLKYANISRLSNIDRAVIIDTLSTAVQEAL